MFADELPVELCPWSDKPGGARFTGEKDYGKRRLAIVLATTGSVSRPAAVPTIISLRG